MLTHLLTHHVRMFTDVFTDVLTTMLAKCAALTTLPLLSRLAHGTDAVHDVLTVCDDATYSPHCRKPVRVTFVNTGTGCMTMVTYLVALQDDTAATLANHQVVDMIPPYNPGIFCEAIQL